MYSKGVKVFGIYFIVWSIITFISAVSSLILYFFSGIEGSMLYGVASVLDITLLMWIVAVVGLIGSLFLFFAGFFIVREKGGIMILVSASLLYILKNVLKSVDDVIKILSPSATNFFAIMSPYTLAIQIFAILFWIFVLWFFLREEVRSQFD